MHGDANIPCVRVPLSGAAAGFKGDLIVNDKWVAEVKGRGKGQGFTLINNWLGVNDMLFLIQDRRDPLVVLPWKTYKELLCQGDTQS